MSTKKLTLDKETLRQMTDGQTQEAVGAGYYETCPPYTTRLSVLNTTRILSIRTSSIRTSSIQTSYESSILPR